MQYPTLSRSTVRHVELVALAPNRLLVVLILSTGRVEQRLRRAGRRPRPTSELADLRALVNRAATGEVIAEADDRPAPRPVDATLDGPCSAPRPRCRRARCWSRRCPTTAPTSGSLVGGAANLARYGDSFDSAVRPLLEALEEHVVLLKLLGEATTGEPSPSGSAHEGPYQELSSTSVVAAGYGPGDEAFARLGIVGPTRMDYPGTMAAVRAVARYVSRILDEA